MDNAKKEIMLVTLNAAKAAIVEAMSNMREQVGHYSEWDNLKDGFELAETIAIQTLNSTIRYMEESE